MTTLRSPHPRHRRVLGLALVLALVLAASALVQAQPVAAEPRVVSVDCDAGESLQSALTEHGAGTSFEVAGTCLERVTVIADGVTIDGAGEAVLDAADDASGPVVHVVGARDFSLRGVTVQNGQHGVLIERMSTVDLEGVIARDNRSHGVEIIFSHATIEDLHAHGNGRVGLIVNRNSEIRLTDALLEENGISGIVLFTSAIARLEGRNVVRGNGDDGFTLGQGGKLFTIGAELVVEGNGAAGMALLQGGAAQFLGGTLVVRDNSGDGIALDASSTIVFGMEAFAVEGSVTSEANEGHGIRVEGGSYLVVDAIMPATSRGNGGSGLFVDASDVRVAASTFADNEGEADVVMNFGARATFDGTSAESVACDDTILIRGALSCP